MKNNLKVFFVLFAFSLMMANCKKDSDSGKKNSIKYNGKEYELSAGILENYGRVSEDLGFNIDLTLMSSEFNIHEENGIIDSISGTGNIMYFEMFTSDSTELDSRNYTFDSQETQATGTFDDGGIGLNFNIQTLEGQILQVTQGTVLINKSGTTYEITVNCKDSGGKDITGYFKGELKYYDYSNINFKKANQEHRFHSAMKKIQLKLD